MVTMHECHLCDKEASDLYFCSGCQQNFCSACNLYKTGDGQPDHDPRTHADLTYSAGHAPAGEPAPGPEAFSQQEG